MKVEVGTIWENIFDSSRAKIISTTNGVITYVKDGGEAKIKKSLQLFLKFYKPL